MAIPRPEVLDVPEQAGLRPAGSESAPTFDEWAARTGPSLLRFARIVAGENDAADVAQDALVAVLLRWRRLSRTGGPDAYARRIIVNRHISRWRRSGRREQLSERVELPLPTTDLAGQIGDATVARQVLAELSPRHRAAVVLRFYDDLAYAEIAGILDCSESTARSYVRRALIRLRELLPSDDQETSQP